MILCKFNTIICFNCSQEVESRWHILMITLELFQSFRYMSEAWNAAVENRGPLWFFVCFQRWFVSMNCCKLQKSWTHSWLGHDGLYCPHHITHHRRKITIMYRSFCELIVIFFWQWGPISFASICIDAYEVRYCHNVPKTSIFLFAVKVLDLSSELHSSGTKSNGQWCSSK